MSEDLAHDAHLRAALRHAPDHALAPPSGLSQTILAAARQAHRPVRPTVAPPPPMRRRSAGLQPLRAWLRRVFAPRWAGAWATGLVAALGLGLWLDLELQPVVERPPVVAMTPPQPENTTRADAVSAPTTAGEAAAGAALESVAKPTPPAPARTPENIDARSKQRAAARAEMSVNEITGASRAEVVAGAAQARAAESGASGVLVLRQGSVAAPPASPPPAVTTAPAAEPLTDLPADQMKSARGRAAASGAEEPPVARSALPANEPPARARSATGLGAALQDSRKAEVGDTVTAASPAFTLLRRAQPELAAGSAVWMWTAPGSAAMTPFDAAAQAWLSRVVQATRGRWVDVGERGDPLGAVEVRWWRDGWPHATLRIEPNGLRWIEPGGRIRYAPLDAAPLQQLRSF